MEPTQSCTVAVLSDVIKSQNVRLLDVFVVGPLMVWGGVKAGGFAGLMLAGLGVSTVLYNADNYQRIAAKLAG